MYAIIDVETTGGSPAIDRIIEIAIVIFDGEKVTNQFTTLLNPKRSIDKYVTQLTGITDKMVKNAPLFADVANTIFDMTNGCIFVAHNVKFDYSLVRSEFKRINIDFVRKRVDTVTLAQKVLPGFSSYSLGTLCDSLGIVVENRHRALGDAEATVKLFDLILKQHNSKKHIEIELNHGIDLSILPPNITIDELEKLPEEPGIVYMKNAQDELLLIEPAKNMRKEAIKFFNKALNNPARQREHSVLTQIDFIATGHEVIAKLWAYEEVKKALPQFNKRPREMRFSYGIFLVPDEEGFLQLRILKLQEMEQQPAMRFSGKGTAHKVLNRIVTEGHLQVLFNLLRQMEDPEQRRNFKKSYNEKLERTVRSFLYKAENFFIIGEGRRPDEKSVVWIEASVYKGFGYISPEIAEMTPENLKACIAHKDDDLETQKIIRNELRKGKGYKMLTY
ncbi:MAG: exonuclease domain-containing protein [Chitinophagales bacterium]